MKLLVLVFLLLVFPGELLILLQVLLLLRWSVWVATSVRYTRKTRVHPVDEFWGWP